MGRLAIALQPWLSVACAAAISAATTHSARAGEEAPLVGGAGRDARQETVAHTSRATGRATLITSPDRGPINVDSAIPRAAVRPINFMNQCGDLHPIPAWLDPTRVVSSDTAGTAAKAALNGEQLTVEQNELVIVDPGPCGDPPIGPDPAYYDVVYDPLALVREANFIDALTGRVLDRGTLVEGTKERRVYSAYNSTSLPGELWRAEGDPITGNADVNRAYDYSGDFYDFFYRMFGRDSFNDQGRTLSLVVHYGSRDLNEPPFCPFAFWNGSQVVMCSGTATDDIIAHQFGSALMGDTAGLLGQGQAGMLSESYSDIWGELIDLFNGNVSLPGGPAGPEWPIDPISDYVSPGTDTPNNRRTNEVCSPYTGNNSLDYPDGVRWLIAEDSTSSLGFGGPLRDMWEPSCYGQPDRALDPTMPCYMGSGVPNHAFAILTDGKTFNGYTVTGIGPIKAAAVWYRALTTYLVRTSDFEDAYLALSRAAQDLIGTTPNDPRTGGPSDSEFSAFDAEQLDLALLAVEMNTQGICGATPDVLNRIPPEQCLPRTVLFSDDFENGAGDWIVENTSPRNPFDWVLTSGLPFDREGTAWFIDDPRECPTGDESAIHSLISPAIAIPEGINEFNVPKLAFSHYVATQSSADGGNLRISVDGGPWQLIATEALEYNAYNTTIASSVGHNPLDGQPAWAGLGGPWGISVVDLSHFVSGSQTVQIRFDFGKDGCRGYDGWWVDDLVVYVCACATDDVCDDGVYCTGAETCVDGFCKKGDQPCVDEYCDEFGLTCIPTVFWDDFDNGNLRGWELGTADDTATDGTWIIGNPIGTNFGGIRVQPENPYVGLGCAYTGENPTGEFGLGDVDDGITYMISPTIDLSGRGTAELSYVRWFYERVRDDDHNDFFAADVSDDNGASWVNLETVTMALPNPVSYYWMPRSFQLEDYVDLTSTFKLRFAAQAEPIVPDDTVEAAVDEVVITASDSCARVDGDADANCRIDLADYASWTNCMTGPAAGPYTDECSVFDFDSDGDVDVRDFAAFSQTFSGM